MVHIHLTLQAAITVPGGGSRGYPYSARLTYTRTIPEPQNKQNYIQNSKASSLVAVWDNHILLPAK